MNASADRSLPSIFLTPFVLAIVALFFFLALLNGQRDLTVLSLLLLCIAMLAKLWSKWSLKEISCSLTLDKCKLFPDETLLLQAKAENRKILPVWLRLSAPVSGGLSLDGKNTPEIVSETGLLWHQKADLGWELTALSRGVHRIGPLTIASGDLFGFFPRSRHLTGISEVVVFPRIVPIQPLFLPPRDFFGIPGANNPVHDPVYILGTRDYHPGSPAKYIHWKATARHHNLQEKIFEPSAQEKLLLAVDVAPFAKSGKAAAFEEMLEAAASTAVRLAERGCAVGLITNGRITGQGSSIVAIARSPNQPAVILETLARLRMETACGILESLQHQMDVASGISCLYFSMEEDETTRLAREYARRRRIPFRFAAGRSSDDSRKAAFPGEGAFSGGTRHG